MKNVSETNRKELNPNCQARQYSDEMHCAVCHLRWDTNDADPPDCNPPKIEYKPLRRKLSWLRR